MPMQAPCDLRRLAAGRRPGHSLEAPFYTSREVFDLDVELIFGRHWIFVAVEPELPAPGDYITRDIGPHAILIVRDDDGCLRAHANVCRHRGAKLVTDERGSVGKLVCPYHQWTYELTARSGRVLECPAEATIRAAARKAGLAVPSSCAKGLCGTCKSRKLDGQVAMHHAGGIRQREIEQGLILICCAKPLSDVAIDR